MSFIKKYNKGVHQKYNDVMIIDNFIYAVGYIDTGVEYEGIITKTSIRGDVLWQKQFTSQEKQGQRFIKIVSCENEDLLVLGVDGSNLRNHSLTRINSSSGNVIWKKYYFLDLNENVSSLPELIKLQSKENYILSFKNYDNTFLNEFHILKINGDGEILNKKRVNGENKLSITDITSDENDNIILSGTQFVSNVWLATFIILNKNLSVLNSFALKNTSGKAKLLNIKSFYLKGEIYFYSSDTSNGSAPTNSLQFLYFCAITATPTLRRGTSKN